MGCFLAYAAAALDGLATAVLTRGEDVVAGHSTQDPELLVDVRATVDERHPPLAELRTHVL